jgi:DNA-binding HxlR family transcriptional regulator
MARRSYNQHCATAKSLDLVGERWTLLLVRELLTGPKRFSSLLGSLAGLGTGLLAERLKYLESVGLIRRVTVSSATNAPAYALTEAGEELRPVVMALSRWGLKWALGERRDGDVFRAGWAVLGMQSTFDAEAARGVYAVYEFRVGDDVFHARIADGAIEALHGPARRPDVVIATDPDTFVELASGRMALADAIEADAASAIGDRTLLRKLRVLFRYPPRQSLPAT